MDGTLQRGSRKLTIGSASGGVSGTVYVAENWNCSEPSKVVAQYNENDAPSAQDIYPDFKTATATLQLPGTTGTSPELGWQTTTLLRGASAIFIVSDVGEVESQGAEKKVNVSFRHKVSAT